MFESINTYTKTEHGYASVRHVDTEELRHGDSMPRFVLHIRVFFSFNVACTVSS